MHQRFPFCRPTYRFNISFSSPFTCQPVVDWSLWACPKETIPFGRASQKGRPPTFTSNEEMADYILTYDPQYPEITALRVLTKNVATTTKQSSATKFPENAASVANARALVLLSLVVDGFGLQGPVMSPQLRTNSAKCELAWFQCILRLSQLKPRICVDF